MTNVIHHDAESLKSPHAEQVHVAGLGENDFVNRLVVLCS